MNIDVNDLVVENNQAAQRFEARIDGQLAMAEYRLQGSTIIFTHTEVPAALEGQGIASKIVQTALDHARDQQQTVVPLCRFVTSFIRRHPEYVPLVDAHYQHLVQRSGKSS